MVIPPCHHFLVKIIRLHPCKGLLVLQTKSGHMMAHTSKIALQDDFITLYLHHYASPSAEHFVKND